MENIYFAPISTLEIILGATSFIIITALALAVYFKNPKSWTNRFFIILAVVLDAYIISNAFSLHPIVPTLANQFFWIRMDMFLGAFMSPALLLLAHTFPANKISMPSKYLWLIITSTMISAILSFTPYLFSSLSVLPNGSGVAPIPSYGMPIYALHFAGLFVLSFFIMFRHYKKALGIEKARLLYLLIGSIGSFSLLIVFIFFATILFQNSSLIFLGPIFPVILMASIAYSIVKHKFLDIQPIIARAVSYTFVVGLLAATYTVALFYIASQFFGLQVSSGILFINTALATIIILTFQPVRLFIGKLTDKLFFKGLYNSDKILTELTHIITRTINLDELVNNLLNTITKELRVTKASMLLITDGKIVDYKEAGIKTLYPFEDLLNTVTSVSKRFFTMDDLVDQKNKDFFRAHEIEAVFPVTVDNKIIAILVLGIKSSGMPYSKQDLNLLDIFVSEAGIAIQNARLYLDLKNALESKSSFINVASHQLRTPLAGIKWGLQELKDSNEVKNNYDILEKSYEQVTFINEQLDDILTALDIYNKKISIQKIQCNVHQLFEEIAKEYSNIIEIKKLKISYDFENESENVLADFSKLRKVLHILTKNSILYSNKGQEIKISTRTEKTDGETNKIITISDQGIGITDSEKETIFNEFFRGDRARQKLPDGLGLGMFIAKAFIESQGGQILISSSGEDAGSSISISLKA